MRVDYFLGVGQGERAQQWLERQFPEITFHTPPNYLRYRSNEQITKMAHDYVADALRSSEAYNYIVIAESQAAPAVVTAIASGSLPMPKQLILLQPLGLNLLALGNTPATRRKELFRRSRLFWSHKNQSLRIAGNRWTFFLLLFQSLRYIHNLNDAYEVGASLNITNALAQIAMHTSVDVYASTDDSLFPFHELERAKGVSMHELSGTHFNRATPLAVNQLQYVMSNI